VRDKNEQCGGGSDWDPDAAEPHRRRVHFPDRISSTRAVICSGLKGSGGTPRPAREYLLHFRIGRIAGDEQDAEGFAARLQTRSQFSPPGQPLASTNVGDQQIDGAHLGILQGQRLRAAAGLDHGVAGGRQNLRDQPADGLLILYQQNGTVSGPETLTAGPVETGLDRGITRGRYTVKVDPSPGWLRTAMAPPLCVTMP